MFEGVVVGCMFHYPIQVSMEILGLEMYHSVPLAPSLFLSIPFQFQYKPATQDTLRPSQTREKGNS
jgi:hypothetical protein